MNKDANLPGSGFYDRYTILQHTTVNSMDLILDRPGQPKCITMVTVNGNQNVAFLGKTPIDPEQFLGKTLLTNAMVIPEFAQMVDPDVLQKICGTIKSTTGGPIEPRKDLFLNEPLQQSILINVCSMSYNMLQLNKHFHDCINRVHIMYRSDDKYGTCDRVVLSSNVNDTGEVAHQLIVFYISKENLQATDKQRGNEVHAARIERKLKQFFADDTFEFDGDGAKIDMSNNVGIFLIPRLMSDQGITYLCIPNIPDYKTDGGRTVSVRQTFRNWLGWVDKYNEDTNHQDIYIKGNDGIFLYSERWSVSMGKDAEIGVSPAFENK